VEDISTFEKSVAQVHGDVAMGSILSNALFRLAAEI